MDFTRSVRFLGGSGLTGDIVVYNPKKINISPQKLESIEKNKNFMTVHLTENGRTKNTLKKLLGDFELSIPSDPKTNYIEKFHYYNMPEYKPFKKKIPYVRVGFLSDGDKQTFFRILKLSVKPSKRWVHFPVSLTMPTDNYEYKITHTINPKYPVYVISLGRWKNRQTVKTLEESNIPYKIFVEPFEYDKYAEVIAEKNIVKLPSDFHLLKQGSVPVRNYVYDYSKKNGHRKHWILDDNINGFFRWNLSKKFRIKSGVLLRLVEDYTERFANIKQAGLNYAMFYPSRQMHPPITFNTRIYSCILMDTSINEKWRGKYNEDTDLSIRIMKRGFSTCLFNSFLCGKAGTLTSSGGNTDTIYKSKSNIRDKAEHLRQQHPEITTIIKKYKRGVHHKVDYSMFKDIDPMYKNKKISSESNEYNMKLIKK